MILSFSRQKLMETCRLAGLSVSGTKAQMAQNLLLKWSDLDRAPLTRRVVAIDLGLRNLGYICADTHADKVHVKEWESLDMELPTRYDPLAYATACKNKLLDRVLAAEPTDILIEEQSWRSVAGHGLLIPQTILKLRSLESLLIGMLLVRIPGDCRLSSISPKTVSETLIPSNTDKSIPRYQFKKKASVALVSNWIDSNQVSLSKNALANYQKASKRDDLCDCLLMVQSWVRWNQNLQSLLS